MSTEPLRVAASMTIDPDGAMDDWIDLPPGWTLQPIPTQEIIHLLETALRGRPKTVEQPDVKAQVAAWRKLAGKWESGVDTATEAARLTKARSPGREVDL